MDPLSLGSNVLALYIKLKNQYESMEENKKNWRCVMDQIFCYDALLREKIEACKSKEGQRMFAGPIKLFHEGIQGIENIFDDYSKRKGVIGRIYGFCADWCNSSDNQKRIMDASRNIAHAAALLNLTMTTSVDAQQKETQKKIAEMMEKVVQMFDQQSELRKSLDQVLQDGGTDDEAAHKFSNILNVPVDKILQNLSDDADLLRDMRSGQKEIQGQISTVQCQLDELKAMISQLSHQAPNFDNTSLRNVIRDCEGNEFWAKNFRGLFAVRSDEFVQAVKDQYKDFSNEMLVSLRRSIDTDGNGSITQGEFNSFCAKKGFSKFLSEFSSFKESQKNLQMKRGNDEIYLSSCTEIFRDEQRVDSSTVGPSNHNAEQKKKFEEVRKFIAHFHSRTSGYEPELHDGKKHVIIIGVTGSGKSTLTNFLAGCKLKTIDSTTAKNLRIHPKSLVVVPISEGGPRDEVTPIGLVFNRSETKVLQPVELDEFIVWDAPGFEDTVGPEDNITNAVNLYRLLHGAQKGGFVMVVVLDAPSLFASRGALLARTIKILLQLFGNKKDKLEQHMKDFIFLASKAGDLDLETIQSCIASAAADGGLENLTSEQLENRVLIIDPIGSHSQRKSRDELIEVIKNTNKLEIEEDLFSISLNDSDILFLERMFGTIKEKIRCSLEDGNFEQILVDFAIVPVMKVIPNRVITSNISEILDDILDNLRIWFQQIQVLKSEYGVNDRKTIKTLLDKLDRSKVLQPLMETRIETFYTQACQDIKNAERKYQNDENNELSRFFHESLESVQKALDAVDRSNPRTIGNLFGFDKVVSHHCATIGKFRLYQPLKEINTMCLFFKKVDLLIHSRQSNLRFIFGDQSDLEALVEIKRQTVEDYFQKTIDRHLLEKFTECLVALKQNAENLDDMKVAALTNRVLDLKDIPCLSSFGFNPALCSDIDILMRNIERYCADKIEGERRRFEFISITVHRSACLRFAEKLAGDRKNKLLSFESQIVLSERALQIVKGTFQLDKEFANRVSILEDDWQRIKSIESYQEIMTIFRSVECSEAATFSRIRAESEDYVQKFASSSLLQSKVCLLNLEKAASAIIEQFSERLIEHSLGIKDIPHLSNYGFDVELCKEINSLTISLKDHSVEQYKELESLLCELFSRLYRQACLRSVEKQAVARKELCYSLEKEIDMKVKAILIVEGKVSIDVQLKLKLAGSDADWSKMKSKASTLPEVAEVIRRTEKEELSFLKRLKSAAYKWVEDEKKAKEEQHRLDLISQVKTILKQGEIERDCQQIVAALDDLKNCSMDKIEGYNACVESLQTYLDSLQRDAQIELFLVTENFNGLIDRYRMLSTLVPRLKPHLDLKVEGIWRAADKKCKEVVRNAREEIKRGVDHPEFLSQTALRTCYGILTTVESTFKLESLRTELLKDVTETVETLVNGVVAELKKKTAELSSASLEFIAKLLIKGYGMSSELGILQNFTKFVRSLLLNSLDSRQKYEVGTSLMTFTNIRSEGGLESTTRSDTSELARAILETFPEFQIFGIEMFNAKTGIVKFDDACKKLQCIPPVEKSNTKIQDAFQAYEKHYTAQVKLIVTDIEKFEAVHSPENRKKIASISDNLKPQALCLNKECAKLGELLGLICSEWTFLSARKSPSGLETKYVMQPHCVQIIGVLRLLAIDEDELENHLIQINTGEGKSIAIGFTAILLAKLGFNVNVVCYSSYFSLRDEKAFEELFEVLGEKRHISYDDFSTLSNKIIDQDGIFPSTRDIFLSFLQGKPYTTKTAAVRPSILLLDEVDVFFSSSFFGRTFNPIVNIPDEESFLILEYVWNNRASLVKKSEAAEEILKLRHSALLLQKYSNLEPFLRTEINKMLLDIRKFVQSPNPQLREINPKAVIDIKNQQVGYEMSNTGVPSFNTFYGYETAFSYFLLADQNVFRATAKQGMRIVCPCGKLLFSEIPRNYAFCLGMTGTLDCLTEGQNLLLKSYNFIRKTLLPSTFKKQKTDRKKTSVTGGVGEKAWDEYFAKILKDIVTELKKGRAILIIFADYSKLDRFAKAIKTTYPKNVPEYKPPQELTDKLPASNRDAVIVKSIRKYMITLMTRSYGRGTDFVCRDQGLVANGGVHVIITFLPEHESEEMQIMGRTCRQDDPGSARKILLLEDLSYLEASDSGRLECAAKLGLTLSDEEDPDSESENGWDPYLAELRKDMESKKFKKMQEEEENPKKLHRATIGACDAVRQGRMHEARSLFVQIAADTV